MTTDDYFDYATRLARESARKAVDGPSTNPPDPDPAWESAEAEADELIVKIKKLVDDYGIDSNRAEINSLRETLEELFFEREVSKRETAGMDCEVV